MVTFCPLTAPVCDLIIKTQWHLLFINDHLTCKLGHLRVYLAIFYCSIIVIINHQALWGCGYIADLYNILALRRSFLYTCSN